MQHQWLTRIIPVIIIFGVLAGCSPAAPTPTAVIPEEATPATATATAPGGCYKLNLNDFTEAQLLAKIPNFSADIMHEFFEYQPYASIQDFRNELSKYVAASDVAAYEAFMYVPVEVNRADSDTFRQLTGVDAAIAAALIDARPYASNEAFLAELASHVSPQQLAEASCYLAAA